MAAWLSSTAISHHDLLPHIPLIHLSAVKSSPLKGIAPQSLNSSSQLSFPETRVSAHRVFGCGKDCLILTPFRLPLISCFTLSLKWFSSNSDNCRSVGIGSLLQFLHQPRVGPVLVTVLFSPLVPSSYRVLRGPIYSFPLVRCSCLLSAGLLHALLCCRCAPGVSVERADSTSASPTPPPCSQAHCFK